MSVKAEMAFDVCWELYREAREVLEAKRGVAALDLKEGTKYSWRPDSRPKLKDWVADFALAGQAALEGPERASRMVMFRLYYLGLAPYERARHFLGLEGDVSAEEVFWGRRVRLVDLNNRISGIRHQRSEDFWCRFETSYGGIDAGGDEPL